jgi:hypothetical protein
MDYDKKARYMFGIDYCSNHQGAKWLREFAAEVLREEAIPLATAEANIPREEGGTITRWDACDNVRQAIERRAAELEGRIDNTIDPEYARRLRVQEMRTL